MNGLMSGLYQTTEWISKFAVVNMMWLLLNAPIVLILLNMAVGENNIVALSSLLLVILVPFVFFPATAAMFAMVRDWILKQDEQTLWLSFLKYYIQNYVKSMQTGCVLTLLWGIIVVDIYYLSRENVLLLFSFIIVGILLFIYTINVFSTMVHYDITLCPMLKKALLFTFGSPIHGIAILFSSLLIFFVSVDSLRFIIPFFSGSLIAYISFSAFYKVYLKFAGNLQ